MNYLADCLFLHELQWHHNIALIKLELYNHPMALVRVQEMILSNVISAAADNFL